MTRQERLKFCKTCQKREFDFHKGILCSLTHEFADFEESCPDFELDEKIQSLEAYKKEKTDSQKIIQKERRKKKEEKHPEKISWNDIFLLLWTSLLTIFIIRLVLYISYGHEVGVRLNASIFNILFVYFMIGLSQIFRNKAYKRFRFFGDMKFKLLFSTFFTFFIISYMLFIPIEYQHMFLAIPGMWIIIFLICLLSPIIVLPGRLINRKFAFNIKQNKLFTRIAGSLLILLLIVEGNIFIKEDYIEWSKNKEVSADNFKGYPNILCGYSAAIYSDFKYEIKGDKYKDVEVKTLMHCKHSWVNKRHAGSDYLLRHEQYHFNISEIAARKFKRDLLQRKDSKIDEKELEEKYRIHKMQLMQMQYNYDNDCNHGLILEKQKDWEYLVDSMLARYSIYYPSISDIGKEMPKKVKYCRQFGVNGDYSFKILFPISEETANQCAHYRIRYDKKQISGIYFYNRNKAISDSGFGVHGILIDYQNNGNTWHYIDSLGHACSGPDGEFYKSHIMEDHKIITSYFNKDKKLTNNNEGFCKIVWSKDSKGRRTSGYFLDTKGQRVTDGEGIDILNYKYNYKGQLKEEAYFDSNFNPKNNSKGFAGKEYFYDEVGNPIRIRAFDSDRVTAPFSHNIAEDISVWDENGYLRQKTLLDNRGRTIVDENGASSTMLKYDNYGNNIEFRLFGKNKNLIISKQGVGHVKRKFDSLGRITEAHNYDAYLNYMDDITGKCLSKYEYDGTNFPILEYQYTVDTIGEPVFFKKIKYAYNKFNNITEEQYFNEDDSFINDTNGMCIKKYVYNDDNRRIEEGYFDEDHSLVNYSNGIASIKYSYNNAGILTEIAYFNANGELSPYVEGIAKQNMKYDKNNLLKQITFIGPDNKGCKNKIGVEQIRYKYNSDKRLEQESYFTASGQRMAKTDGISTIIYEYTPTGLLFRSFHFDVDAKAGSSLNGGVFAMIYEYNDLGFLSRIYYYDEEGNLQQNKDGYAIENYYYDSRDHLSRIEYLSKYRLPILSSHGWTSENYTYDLNGNMTSKTYRDEANALVEDEHGYAIYNFIYNRNGYITDTLSYPANEHCLDSIDHGPFYRTNITAKNDNHVTYKPNKKNGVVTEYYENGVKQSEVSYVNGQKHGVHTTWYANGRLCSEVNYINGIREGVSTEYYSTGGKWRQVTYNNGQIVKGSEISWDMYGHING